MFRYVFLTLYNRTEMESRKLPDMYETVKNGDWTLDTQLSMIKDLYRDKNSDSKGKHRRFLRLCDRKRQQHRPLYGGGEYPSRCQGCGHAGTEVRHRLAEARLRPASQSLLLYNDASTYFYRNSTSIEDWAGRTKNIINAFTAKNAMMVTCLFLDMETEIESLTPMSYGIAPLPKFDKAQTRYYSMCRIGCPASAFRRCQVGGARLHAGCRAGVDGMEQRQDYPECLL